MYIVRCPINVRQEERQGGREGKRKDRKKKGKVTTKSKAEMTMSYPQIGEVGMKMSVKAMLYSCPGCVLHISAHSH